jgi:hypothetical protein
MYAYSGGAPLCVLPLENQYGMTNCISSGTSTAMTICQEPIYHVGENTAQRETSLLLSMVVLAAEAGVVVIAGGLVSAMSVLAMQGFFDALFRMSDTATCCLVDVLL